jgi:hypothetical protein
MFGAMKEYDELAMLEEIQKELISQGTKLESHSNYCYEIGDVSSGNGSRSDFFWFYCLSELSIIEEYERNQQFEEQYISSIVEGREEDAIHIICPICHGYAFGNNLWIVFCMKCIVMFVYDERKPLIVKIEFWNIYIMLQ